MIAQFIGGAKHQPKIYYGLGAIWVQYTTQSIEVLGVTVQTIEGVVRYILKDTTTVSDICSDRIYWLKTPQKPTLPYVEFHAISDPHEALYMTIDESKAKAGQRHFEFTCVSDDSLEALDLQQALMSTLRWAQGVTYGFTIEIITIENMRHDVEPETDLYANKVEARVEYYEA